MQDAQTPEDKEYAIEGLMRLAQRHAPKLDFDPKKERDNVLESINTINRLVWILITETLNEKNKETPNFVKLVTDIIVQNIKFVDNSPAIKQCPPEELN